jgi:hypothetical protein
MIPAGIVFRLLPLQKHPESEIYQILIGATNLSRTPQLWRQIK